MSTRLAATALALASLGFIAPACGQNMNGPCQEMTGQYDVNGRLKMLSGVACLQPDGTWQMVDISGAGGTYDDSYYYGGDPWYWAPYGFGAVIIIDRFHHVHHVSHVFMHRPGVGFHGGMGGFHGGMGGGFHGNGGGFHSGGGHR